MTRPGRSCAPSPFAVGVIFIRAVRASLKAFADRIGRKFGLFGHCLRAEVFRTELRAIAITLGVAVVPPASLIIGRPVENLEMDVRMLKPDSNKLCQILWLDPDRQPPFVERLVVDVADADARHAQPVLVGIERADRLAEGLAHAVAAVGTYGHIHA